MREEREHDEREHDDEHEHDDEQHEHDDEPEQPAEQQQQPAAGMTEAQLEAQLRKLDGEAERHAKAVARVMGDDFAQLVPCPLCWQQAPGYRFPVPPADPEQIEAVRAALGLDGFADYAPAEDAQPCDTCNALGRVLTGSRVQGQETKPCASCTGTGWRSKVSAAQPAPVVQFPPPHPPAGTADSWGRPLGHPHYGLDPARLGV